MHIELKELLTVSFTLFAVIDILGVIPVLISLKSKLGGIHELRATVVSGALMILFLFLGSSLLNMLGVEFFKSETEVRAATLVPIAFPLIAGSGTLTTIISLKANYDQTTVLLGIIINLVFVYIVLKSLRVLERLLGPAGLIAIRKFFGVVLLAIAVKIFATNAHGLIR
jgi:multiple antibiotic resistance protein